MGNIGFAEVLVIFLIALLVFGPDKLPDFARQIGKAVREFRRIQASLQDEVRDVFDPGEGPNPPSLPPLPTPKDALGHPPEVGGDDDGARLGADSGLEVGDSEARPSGPSEAAVPDSGDRRPESDPPADHDH